MDLAGMHVYPALTDSHLHLLYTLVLAANSFAICQVGPGGVEPGDLAGAERRMRLYCSQNPRQKIVVANGYIPSAIAEKRLPTRRELDEWTGGKSCVVYSIDGQLAPCPPPCSGRWALRQRGTAASFGARSTSSCRAGSPG